MEGKGCQSRDPENVTSTYAIRVPYPGLTTLLEEVWKSVVRLSFTALDALVR